VRDLAEIPDNIKNKLEIIPVKWIDKVLELALERLPDPLSLPEDAALPVPGPSAKDLPAQPIVTH
jgi:ATP-dependent Lon protease